MNKRKLFVYESFDNWYFNLPVIYMDIKDFTEHFNEITDQTYIDGLRVVPVYDLLFLDRGILNVNNRTPF